MTAIVSADQFCMKGLVNPGANEGVALAHVDLSPSRVHHLFHLHKAVTEITILALINNSHISSNSQTIHLSYIYLIVVEYITRLKSTNTCKLYTKSTDQNDDMITVEENLSFFFGGVDV